LKFYILLYLWYCFAAAFNLSPSVPRVMSSLLGNSTVLLASATSHIDLAIARSLGRAGARVVAAVPPGGALAACSKYVSGRLALPSDDSRAAAEVVIDAVRSGAFTHVISAREDLIVLLNERRSELERFTELLFPEPASFEQCLYKDRTCALAEELGIPIPRSVVPDCAAAVEACRTLRFPVVVKPRHRDPRSRTSGARDYVAMYVNSFEELVRELGELDGGDNAPIVQEFCRGEGIGVEVLMRAGEALAVFQHRRLREKPATGGISVLCESVDLDSRLAGWAVSLLKAMKWDGVAMVEYRVDPHTADARLLEVNGRFWGSLPLAIRAGVDFPALYLMSRVAPESVPRMPEYKAGVRCRSLAHDTAALLDTLRTGNRPRMRAIGSYFASFSPLVGGYVWSWRDPMPSLLHPWIRLRRRLSAQTRHVPAEPESRLAER
jgi:predicted ATP-grasp superfamily ATP-dependent carboligase